MHPITTPENVTETLSRSYNLYNQSSRRNYKTELVTLFCRDNLAELLGLIKCRNVSVLSA